MDMDTLFLSRLQFALTIGFHFLFPPISIGLAWLLVAMEGASWRTGNPVYERMSRMFAKLLALTFVVGVATGIVMEFQFGTNWSEYSKFVGDIFGAPLAAESVFAFFMESTFLGLYLFGRNRVSKGIHWFSILMVAVGATISAFWIIAANSWQQTPAGYIIQNNRAELTSFTQAIFNDSTWLRFFHTFSATIVCGAFVVTGVSAYWALKKKDMDVTRRSMKLALIVGFIASVLTAFPTGHEHAIQVAKTQPEKFATMEGLLETQTRAPLLGFAIPLDNPPRLIGAIEIPGVLSLMAHGDIDAEVKGLDAFAEDERPPFFLTFVSFHNMVALGTLFIGMMAFGLFLLYRGVLWETKWFLAILVAAIPLPLVATQLGWIVAEVGRQPWVVYRLLRTADAFSPTVSAGEVLFSIVLFGTIYLFLGALYLFVFIREVKEGPVEKSVEEVKV
jgi:cytochrome bd ubiquinol oxidase subunit I